MLQEGGSAKFGWKELAGDSGFRGRTGHSADRHKAQIYIFGGQSFKHNTHTNEVWVYDTHLEKVNLLETKNAPEKRNSHGACVDPVNGHLYVFGGANDDGLLGDMHR